MDYNRVKDGEKYKDRWDIFGQPNGVEDELITMKGVIRSISKYVDGSERFEIPLKDTGKFPIVYKQRLNYTWSIGDMTYIISLRFTKDAGGWICPDLYNFNNPEENFPYQESYWKMGTSRMKRLKSLLTVKRKKLR